jgi:hypothetical protein
VLEEGIVWPTAGEKFWDRAARSSPATLAPTTPAVPVERDPESLHIVHITAEMAPIAKVACLLLPLLLLLLPPAAAAAAAACCCCCCRCRLLYASCCCCPLLLRAAAVCCW